LRILLLGEGAALHALAWKMVSETEVVELYCAPGNAGTTLLLGPAPFQLHATEIAQWAFAQQVDLVVVQDRPDWVETLTGVELPVLGVGEKQRQALFLHQKIRDRLRSHAVPLPSGQAFREREAAERYIASRALPLWLCPNEAAEKEVVRVAERFEAFQEFARLLGCYPENGVYIEEEVDGPEAALGLLCDGTRVLSLGVSRPYNRRYEGDTGPSTEGMGAYAPYGDVELEDRLMAVVGRPVVAALHAEGLLRPSFLHLRIALGSTGPVLRELAWDLDDLHAVVMLPRWAGDLARMLQAAARGQLEETAVSWKPGIAVAVAVVADNYPGPCPGGQPLGSVHDTPAMVWHHATRLRLPNEPVGILSTWLRPPTAPPAGGLPDQVVTAGGRALFVVGCADSAYESCQQAYQGVGQLAFEHSDWRQDIAAELL
jgi:phosphoribosylamine--glycine ligase